MTYIIDLQRLWADRKMVLANPLQVAPGAYIDPRHCAISAVVVAQADQDKLLKNLIFLCDQLLIREVVVVNCEASSQIEEALRQFVKSHPKCYIVTGRSRMGVAAAYNLGVRYTSGQFLLFLDLLCVLPKNAILKLLATGLHKPHPWVVGPLSEKDNINLPEVSLPGGGIHVASLTADCLFIPTKDFLALQGLDERCLHSAFHLDLCMRIHLAGGGVYQACDVQATTDPGRRDSLSLVDRLRQDWQACRGQWYFEHKHFSRKTNLFFRVIRDCTLGLRLLVKRFIQRLCQ